MKHTCGYATGADSAVFGHKTCSWDRPCQPLQSCPCLGKSLLEPHFVCMKWLPTLYAPGLR